jgi:hypothetical protein
VLSSYAGGLLLFVGGPILLVTAITDTPLLPALLAVAGLIALHLVFLGVLLGTVALYGALHRKAN